MRTSAILVLTLAVLAGLTCGNNYIVSVGDGGGEGGVKMSPQSNEALPSVASTKQVDAAKKSDDKKLEAKKPEAKQSGEKKTEPTQTMCNHGTTLSVSGQGVADMLKAGATLGACAPSSSPTPTKASTTKPNKKVKAGKKVGSEKKGETKKQDQITICLVQMNSSVQIPISSLEQFLSKGATIGNCSATSTKAPVTSAPSTLAPLTLAPLTPAPTLAPIVPPPGLAIPQIVRQPLPPAIDCDEPASLIEDSSSSSEDDSSDDGRKHRRARKASSSAKPRSLAVNGGASGDNINSANSAQQPAAAQRLFKP